jgi:hypothetical protein
MTKSMNSGSFSFSAVIFVLLATQIGCKPLPDFNNPLDPNATPNSTNSVTLYHDPMDSLSAWTITQPFSIWNTWSNGYQGYCIGTTLVTQTQSITTSIEKNLAVSSSGFLSIWLNKFYSQDTIIIYLDSAVKHTQTSATSPTAWEKITFQFPQGTHTLRIEVKGRASQSSFDELRIEK